MKVMILYGGRGLINDPTLSVISKMEQVFKDLEVNTITWHLQDELERLSELLEQLEGYDGLILATTVEWLGIGGAMQTFLDACWYYGDKEKLKALYMMPVVCATSYGEREAQYHLTKAWDLLGGIVCEGICAYLKDASEIEVNDHYIEAIEKKTEYFYRNLKQKKGQLPKSSYQPTMTLQVNEVPLEPAPNEEISAIKEDIAPYIEREESDIRELSSFFKQKLAGGTGDIYEQLIQDFTDAFVGQLGFQGAYKIQLTDRNKALTLDIDQDDLTCTYEENIVVDVYIQATYDVISQITGGLMTFQRAFMTGVLKSKGDFKLLYTLDQLFKFVK